EAEHERDRARDPLAERAAGDRAELARLDVRVQRVEPIAKRGGEPRSSRLAGLGQQARLRREPRALDHEVARDLVRAQLRARRGTIELAAQKARELDIRL